MVGTTHDEVINSTVKQIKRMFNNLPLLPVDQIQEGFKAVKAYQAKVHDR